MQPSIQDYVLVPVRDAHLKALLSPQGVVTWRFESTLACRILGRKTATQIWFNAIDGPMWFAKSVVWALFLLGLIVVIGLGCLFIVPDAALIVASLTMFFVTLLATVFLLDVRIVRYVVWTGVFWANLLLASIGIISVTFVWNFDYRTCVFPLYVWIVAVTSSFDALPPTFRLYIGVPTLSFLCFLLVAVIVILNFSRFPRQLETPSWNLGTFNGLAERNVIISPVQLATDACIGHLSFLIRALYCLIANRTDKTLYVIKAGIASQDDQSFDHLSHFGIIKRRETMAASVIATDQNASVPNPSF